MYIHPKLTLPVLEGSRLNGLKYIKVPSIELPTSANVCKPYGCLQTNTKSWSAK